MIDPRGYFLPQLFPGAFITLGYQLNASWANFIGSQIKVSELSWLGHPNDRGGWEVEHLFAGLTVPPY